jgi:hypothetical protein
MRSMRKGFLKSGYVGLFIALLTFFGGAQGRTRSEAVSNVQVEQKAKYGLDDRSPVDVQRQTTSDRFTQTEAFLQLRRTRDLLEKESSSRFIPYLNIISDCLVKEQDLKASHYAFYHATGNEWRLAQDLYTQLYARQNPGKTVGETFTFLRFKNLSERNAKEFLVNELKKNGLVDDTGKLGAILLSVNLSLFGNIGWPTSCTWEYFLKEMGHKVPDRKIYEKMMDKFGLSHGKKHIDELLSLVKLYDTKENTLLQIFVPQDTIDDIGYLSWSKGMPMHEESIDWIKDYKKRKSLTKKDGKHPTVLAMEELAHRFKKEKESNPLFKDLMESVKDGDFSVDAFLKVYRNTPWKVSNINNTQVRLIFSPDVLLNPASGVQFYRYSTVSKKRLSEYLKRLNEIVDKIIAEKGGAGNA